MITTESNASAIEDEWADFLFSSLISEAPVNCRLNDLSCNIVEVVTNISINTRKIREKKTEMSSKLFPKQMCYHNPYFVFFRLILSLSLPLSLFVTFSFTHHRKFNKWYCLSSLCGIQNNLIKIISWSHVFDEMQHT